jgi:hypothetical protein
VEVAAGVLRHFIGSSWRGGGRPGSDGDGGVLSRWWPVIEGEAKRRRCRLRWGRGGGGRETSGPMRRRWPEAHDGARRGQPSDDARVSEAGGRR